jgi:hypothetical protein
LNEVKQIALTIVGKYNDEEFHNIYWDIFQAQWIDLAGIQISKIEIRNFGTRQGLK